MSDDESQEKLKRCPDSDGEGSQAARKRRGQKRTKNDHGDLVSDSSDYDDDDSDSADEKSIVSRPGTKLARPEPVLPTVPDIKDSRHMIFQTIHVERFIGILTTIKHILSNVVMIFKRNGFEIKGFNPSKTTMIMIDIQSDMLQGGYYACTHNYMIAVNVPSLHTRLKIAKDAPSMTLMLSGENPDEMNISWTGLLPCSSSSFRLNQASDDDEFDFSTITFKHMVMVPSHLWRGALINFKRQSDQIMIEKNKERMRVSFSDQSGTMPVDFGPMYKNISTFHTSDEEVKKVYRIGPIAAGTKITKHTLNVSICINNANDGLLRVTYNVAGLGEFHIFVMSMYDD